MATFKLENGEIYEGDWADGKFHGKGKYTYAEGGVYEGDFADNERHGKGKLTYADGRVTEGNWKDNEFIDNAEGAPAEGAYLDNIILKYNYKLETGTVGTDDENIAQMLYNINKMEMYASLSTDNLEELDKALGDLFFLTLQSKVHLNRFFKIFENKIKIETFNEVVEILDAAMDEIRANRSDLNDNTDNMRKAASTSHKKILAIVPKILLLDAQAVGRV